MQLLTKFMLTIIEIECSYLSSSHYSTFVYNIQSMTAHRKLKLFSFSNSSVFSLKFLKPSFHVKNRTSISSLEWKNNQLDGTRKPIPPLSPVAPSETYTIEKQKWRAFLPAYACNKPCLPRCPFERLHDTKAGITNGSGELIPFSTNPRKHNIRAVAIIERPYYRTLNAQQVVGDSPSRMFSNGPTPLNFSATAIGDRWPLVDKIFTPSHSQHLHEPWFDLNNRWVLRLSRNIYMSSWLITKNSFVTTPIDISKIARIS